MILDDINKLYLNYAKILRWNKNIVIGWDSEFNADKDEVYSHQFSWYDENGELKQYFWELENYEKVYWDDFVSKVKKLVKFKNGEKIYLLTHFSTAEISTIEDFSSNPKLTRLIDYGKYATYTIKNDDIKILDTMNYQKSKLEKIGQALGVPKISFQSEVEKLIPNYNLKAIEDFKGLLHNSLTRQLCINYALRDSEIALKFALNISYLLYEETKQIKIKETLPSASEFLYIEKFIKTNDKKTTYENWERLGHIKAIYKDAQTNKTHYINKCHNQIADTGTAIYQGGRNQTYFNGIAYGKVQDFDLSGAYTIALKLIKGLEFKRSKHTNKVLKYQSTDYTLETFIEKIFNKQTREELFTLQGIFSGEIAYKKSLYITPTLINADENLAECLIDNSEHHILELIFILNNPNLVIWEKTTISNIKVFKTTDKFIFREYITYLREQRNKHPKGSIFNLLYKLLANGFYGKLAQGVNSEYRKNILSGKQEKKPHSNIFNPLFAGYITAMVRLLTFEVANNFNFKNEEELPLEIVTDGIQIKSDRNEQELIDIFNNLPFNKLIRTMINERSIWELKHVSLEGHVIVKVRIDFPLKWEERWEEDDSDCKIASPSAYTFDGSKKIKIQELNDMYFNRPNNEIPNKRLKGYKDVFKEKAILSSVENYKTINWNIQATKNIDRFIDNEKFKGVILKPFETEDGLLKSLLRNTKNKNKNSFLAYNQNQMSKLEMLNQKNDIRFKTDNSKYSFICNDLIFVLKGKYNFNLTYKKLPLEIKNNLTNENFKKIKSRCSGKKILNYNALIFGLYKKFLNQIIKENNIK